MISWMFQSVIMYIKTQYRKCFRLKLLPLVLKNCARAKQGDLFRGGRLLI